MNSEIYAEQDPTTPAAEMAIATATAPVPDVAALLRKRPRVGESIIEGILFAAGIISILTTLGIVFVLVRDAIDFFLLPEVTLVGFLTNTVWQLSLIHISEPTRPY